MWAAAVAMRPDGTVLAEADGLFLQVDAEHFTSSLTDDHPINFTYATVVGPDGELQAAPATAPLFGGMVLQGITPIASYVSWESHLFGLAAGVLAAFALAAEPGEAH